MVVLGSAGGEATPPTSAVSDAVSVDAHAALTAQVRTSGTLRVLVSLNVPFTPEGELKSAWKVFLQRDRIAQAQDHVLERLRGRGCQAWRTAKRFESVPSLGLKVDLACLEALWQDPDVREIQPDQAVGATEGPASPQ